MGRLTLRALDPDGAHTLLLCDVILIPPSQPSPAFVRGSDPVNVNLRLSAEHQLHQDDAHRAQRRGRRLTVNPFLTFDALFIASHSTSVPPGLNQH